MPLPTWVQARIRLYARVPKQIKEDPVPEIEAYVDQIDIEEWRQHSEQATFEYALWPACAQ